MEGAFTHFGNHLVSDSASAINAGDDLSTIDADENALDREYGRDNLTGGPRRRKIGEEEDNESQILQRDDDLESPASVAVNGHDHDGPNGNQEQEVELPAHACS